MSSCLRTGQDRASDRMHGGEIACLKGLQGEKGYVAGLDIARD